MNCSICNNVLENETNPFSNSVCDLCYDAMNGKDCNYLEFIENSTYKPLCFTFYRNKHERKNNLYCGIELEIQRDDREGFIQENVHNPFIYYKEDASLDTDIGIEIVSHPATLKYHLMNWKNIFDSINRNGLNDINNCGLHFHFNRDAFTFDEIASLDYFINNSQNIIEDIGGRKIDNFYSKIVKKSLSSYGKTKEMYIDRCGNKKDIVYNRYYACNLTNKTTIELRFCKSTDDYKIFIDRLKKVFALVLFCKHNNTILEDIIISQNKFLKYMNHYIKGC